MHKLILTSYLILTQNTSKTESYGKYYHFQQSNKINKCLSKVHRPGDKQDKPYLVECNHQ